MQAGTVVDITRSLRVGMAIYPGNPEVAFKQVAPADENSSAVTKIVMGSHSGTHIDAPAHITAGAAGTASYGLGQFSGPAEVIDLTAATEVISGSQLPKTTAERVLIKTINSSTGQEVFDESFVALEESAARELAERGVVLVGIDAPSIKKKGIKDQTHALLLEAGIIILEGLWLPEIEAGSYELLCLPLAVDLDGAPARAALRYR